MHRRTASRTALLLALLIAAVTACGADDDGGGTATAEKATTEAPSADGDGHSDEGDPAGEGDHAEDGDHADDHPDAPAGAEEAAEAVVRLAVADPTTGALALIDLAAPDDVTTLDLSAPATGASTTEDGRHLVVRHEDAVTLVDGGAWSEGHDDHDHHFVAAPAVVGEVTGDHPSHLVSHGGRLALFFDGTGEAVVLDEAALADGEVVETDTIHASAPHHGFALPLDGGYAVTEPAGAPEGELPEAVAVTDASGEVVDTFPCAATHGEAAVDEGVAAACGDGVLLVRAEDDGWAATTVAYPDVEDTDPYGEPAPRAWSLATGAYGDTLVGVLGSRHLVRVDVEEGTAEAVDVGAPIASRGLALLDDGVTAAVLATDGVLRLVDTGTGTVTAEVEVLAPFAEGEDDVADRQLVVHGERAWVTDPTERTATEVALGPDAAVTRTLDLPVVPGAVQVVGG